MACLDDLVLRATTDPLVILPCKMMSYMQGLFRCWKKTALVSDQCSDALT